MVVRILVSGTLAALTVAAAQAPAINGGGRIDTTGAGDVPTVAVMAVAFVLASVAQWLISSVQIEKMTRNRRLNRALLSGIVALGMALFSVDIGITWSKLLATAVAVGLAGPSAVDLLMKRLGMDKQPPPPADKDEEGGDK